MTRVHHVHPEVIVGVVTTSGPRPRADDPWLNVARARARRTGDYDAFTMMLGWDDMGPVVGPHESSDAYWQQVRAEQHRRWAEDAMADYRTRTNAEERAFLRDHLGVDDMGPQQQRLWDFVRRARERQAREEMVGESAAMDHQIITGHRPYRGCCGLGPS